MKCTVKSSTNKTNVAVCVYIGNISEKRHKGVVYRGYNSGAKLNAASLVDLLSKK